MPEFPMLPVELKIGATVFILAAMIGLIFVDPKADNSIARYIIGLPKSLHRLDREQLPRWIKPFIWALLSLAGIFIWLCPTP